MSWLFFREFVEAYLLLALILVFLFALANVVEALIRRSRYWHRRRRA